MESGMSMNTDMHRRDFLKAAPLAAYGLSQIAKGQTVSPPTIASAAKIKIEAFDYRGVRLRASRWQKQFQAAHDFWLSLPENDILHGYRAAAGLAAPGKPLGGWCARTSDTVFGQWLSGMSRVYRATGDTAIRDKAVRLFTEWAKTVKPDGDCGMRHYPFDKLVCGLVDLKLYADVPDAIPVLEKVVDWASKTFSRENVPSEPQRGLYSGRVSEWYTLSENLYRAFQLTGNAKFKDFGDAWLYNSYWNKFANTASPPDAQGVHAYSHVNTFSSAAMAYSVSGDEKFLRIIKNAYDYLQNVQCYATGGFGPSEFIVSPDGGLGRALDTRQDSFETGCGSWAAFKLSRYLTQFTGESRYGDWTERIFYNGIGAALPVTADGKNFYYSDYRVDGGMKVYNWEAWTCCSGTYIQAVADYHNIIYFKDAGSLYVNLFVSSDVVWTRADGDVKLTQETNYPEAETSTLTLELKRPATFALKFRVPAWTHDASVKVNDVTTSTACMPGFWAAIEREWKSGDRVEIRIPLPMRMLPVDRQHPNRVAVARGPVAMVLEAAYHDAAFRLPETDEQLNQWLVADATAGVFKLQPPDGSRIRSLLRPFYTVEENYPYKIYFDKDKLPIGFW
jgi:DUF1680 family protein